MKKIKITILLLLVVVSKIANANCYAEIKEENMAVTSRNLTMVQAWNSDVLWIHKKVLEEQIKMAKSIEKTNQCIHFNKEWYEKKGQFFARLSEDSNIHESTSKYIEAVVRLLESRGL